jgi:hypothetical protein
MQDEKARRRDMWPFAVVTREKDKGQRTSTGCESNGTP